MFPWSQFTVTNSDLPNQPMKGTLQQCQEACSQNNSCVGFSWPTSASSSSSTDCYLKQSYPSIWMNNGWVNYGIIENNTPQYTLQNFVQFITTDSDLPSQPMTGTVEECQTACNQNNSCIGFSWPMSSPATSSTSCWLKQAFPSLTSNDASYQTYVKY
jgi:hypothetical protein